MRIILFFTIICLAVGTAAAGQNQSIIEKLRVTPAQFNRGTALEIEPVLPSDADQDYEFEYRWFVNGEENIYETSADFPGDELQRGDQLTIEVTPITQDGERLKSFVSQQLTTANASPIITSELPEQLSGNVFSYQVEATDPDDDPLTFSLEDASQEMTIDGTSGELVCNLDQHQEASSFSVVIVVKDPFGGRDEQRFKLDLSFVEQKGESNE